MKIIKTILRGGMLVGKRKLILAIVGIVAALGAYLVGDSGLIDTIVAIVS